MIDLLIYSDGARDHVTVPRLVGRILGVTVRPRVGLWAHLRQGGYRRKLRFAIGQAKDADAVGLVATVDQDDDHTRRKLQELIKARDEDRASSPPFPIALGEAVPHAEAWLLDDRLAVCDALCLNRNTDVPTIRQTKNPKATIEDLRRQGKRAEDSILNVLASIADKVDPRRCGHGKETGFEGFVKEVRQELGPMAAGCGEECRCGDACASADAEG